MYLQTATTVKGKLPPFVHRPARGNGSTVEFLKSKGTLQTLTPGQILFAEGDDAEQVFEVVNGIVKLCRLLPDGRRQIVDFVTEQKLVGFDDDDTYSYSAEAVTEVSVSCYRRHQFERMVDEVPGLARRILAARCRDLHSAQDQMLLLGRKTAVERIASFLLRLSELQPMSEIQPTGSPDGSIKVPMTRCDIADYLGLTIETVSRSLTKLRRDKIIDLPTATHVEVVDRERLEELAGCEGLEMV